MIADVFLYHDEVDMLRCRSHELDGVVDMHVAIEGNRTMSGEPREYRLSGDEVPNLEVVRADISDVDDVEMPLQSYRGYEYVDNWRRDWKQRLAAAAVVDALPDDAIVMYGDVDEIPRREVVEAFHRPSVATLAQVYLCYGTGWCIAPLWSGTVIGMKAAHFGPFPRVRSLRNAFPHLARGGWHLGWFGGRDAVVRKVQDFAHGEMAEDLGAVASDYDERIWPGSGGPLIAYTGDLPRLCRDGLAPATWEGPS